MTSQIYETAQCEKTLIFPFTQNEDLATAIPMTIKQTLGVDVKFSIIHRNGIRAMNNGKPVSITARLTDRTKKDEILNAQRAKKIAKQRLPFFITPQQPSVIHANKNKIYDKANSLKKTKFISKGQTRPDHSRRRISVPRRGPPYSKFRRTPDNSR